MSRLFQILALFVLFTGSLVTGGPATAQVYNCDGKWTNKPCTGKVLESLEAEPKPGVAGSNAAKVADVDDIQSEIKKSKLSNASTQRPTPPPPPSGDEIKKSAMVSALHEINGACKNYYNRSQLRVLENICKDKKASLSECANQFNEMHSTILANTKDAACRNKIFAVTNRIGSSG